MSPNSHPEELTLNTSKLDSLEMDIIRVYKGGRWGAGDVIVKLNQKQSIKEFPSEQNHPCLLSDLNLA